MKRFLALACLLLVAPLTANAVIINSVIKDIGDPIYKFNFNVVNDDPLRDIVELGVFFSPDDFGVGLNVLSLPAGATGEVFDVDGFLEGIFIAHNDTDALVAAGMSAHFAVSAPWNGAGLPGSLEYLVVFDDFGEAFGETIATIPEPGAIGLVLLGLVLLVLIRRPADGIDLCEGMSAATLLKEEEQCI